MEIREIVLKLVGNINPAGDASRDGERFNNLVTLCNLVETLVYEINYVSHSKDSYESSVKRAGVYADKFLKNLKDEL